MKKKKRRSIKSQSLVLLYAKSVTLITEERQCGLTITITLIIGRVGRIEDKKTIIKKKE